MPDPETPPQGEVPEIADAEVRTRGGISIVWLVPIVAAATAGWLIFTTLAEKGPTITIRFDTAEGLEAGKTKVKYKDVEVGLVEEVRLSDDLSNIIVRAEMKKGVEAHLTDKTRFWVLRPRLTATGVSGLGTLVSGVYIEADLAPGGRRDDFVGLEEPPLVRSGEAGREYVLSAASLGSISRGSPISFRGIAVGEVQGYELAADNRHVELNIFIKAPHDKIVRPGTRFWNASGIDATLDADGVRVAMESVQSLLIGGIAFETPPAAMISEPSPAGTRFELFEDYELQREERYRERTTFVSYFEGSVRGLSEGAPVEFRGIRVGTVTDVRLEFNPETQKLRIPVVFDIEPERVRDVSEVREGGPYKTVEALVARGLRAQLRQGNLITGQLLVTLDFHPDAEPAALRFGGPHPEMPAIPSKLDQIARSVNQVLSEIASLPLAELVADIRSAVRSVETSVDALATDEVSKDLRAAFQSMESLVESPEIRRLLVSLDDTMQKVHNLVARVDNDAGPLIASLRETSDAARKAIEQANLTMHSARDLVGEDSMVRHNLVNMLSELTEAARSIRVLADYLEQHPEALVKGKGDFAK